MPRFQERHSKRFHVTLQVPDLQASIQEYCEILGQDPCCIIPGRLVLWRTGELNFLLRAKPKQRTAVLQFGWEFDYLENTQRFKDRNQLSWLFFSTGTQDAAINRLNTELEYYESSDFLLELCNPNAHWNLWASLLLLAGMLAFTVFNNAWLKNFFRPGATDIQAQAKQSQDLQQLYGAKSQLEAVATLLRQSGYAVSFLDNYAIAQDPEQASITFQVLDQQILFSTYWSLRRNNKVDHDVPGSAPPISEQEIQNHINQINREAILCRYYQDEDGDLAVEAWFSLPPLLLLQLQKGTGAHQTPINASDTKASDPNELDYARKQVQLQWQKILSLWQQESLSWIQSSQLFGGELEPHQSFSKK